MEHGETIVTDDPEKIADRDYNTLAYAEKPGTREPQATGEFAAEEFSPAATTDGGQIEAGEVAEIERSESILAGDDPLGGEADE
jgi:precorrin-2/cobalt-factor-2 C20-methyltransferase